MNENLLKILSDQKILPIIRSGEKDKIINIVNALYDAGIKIVEINLLNTSVYDAIKEVSNKVHVCAGGVITSMQLHAAVEAGAKIFSSPIFHMNLVKLSNSLKIPYIAGTSTANEAYAAWKARTSIVKIYPITAIGGVEYVENLLRPMPFLNVLPQGDVKLSEVNDYINAGAHSVGVGRDLYEGYSYSEITKRIKEFYGR